MVKLIIIGVVLGFAITACDNSSSSLDVKFSAPSTYSDGSSILSKGNYAAGSLIPIANMQASRAAHTATLLKDGNVLICGGFAGSSSNSLASAELYHPTSKTFTKISPLTTPRVNQSATLLPNGKVLIAGGYNGNSLLTTEIFDPNSQTFSPGPDMNTARYGHTATLLNNGKILFVGGVGTGWTFLSSAEIYDMETNTFVPVKSMADARESHTATLLQNGNVLITGGHRDRRANIKLYSSAEIFDSKTNQFSPGGNMNIPRHKHDAVLLSDGKVLINGGADKKDIPYNTAEIYDPKNAQFTPISDMNYPRYKHKETSILMADKNVLIGGGSEKAEIYDSKSGRFIPLEGNIGSTRLFSCATLLANGEVLITGGYDENIKARNGAHLYVKK